MKIKSFSKFVLLMLLLLCINVVAQTTDPMPTVTIGSGTDTSGDFPTYACSKYSYTQQLYTASELGTTAGAILNIGFYYQKEDYGWGEPINEFTRTLDFYIVSTDKNEFDDENDWVSVTSSDLCFSGSVTFTTDDWTTITLDNPFIYDGSSNIVIAVFDKTDNNLDYLPFLAFDSDGQSLYVQDDGYGTVSVNPLDFDASTFDGGYPTTGYYKNQIRINVQSEIPRPKSLSANYNGGTEVELSWSSTESSFELSVNGQVQSTAITSCTYKLEGLQYKTTNTIMVRAKNGDQLSEWSDPVVVTTAYCASEDMCQISFELSDGGGDGWDESAIIVMVADDGYVLGKVTFEERWASKTVTMNVPDGKEIEFIWSKSQYGHSQYDNECSYVVKNHNGVVIFSGEGALKNPVYHEVDCNSTAMPCVAPTNLRATAVAANSALLSWDGNNMSYQLELRPWLQVGKDVAPADEMTQYSFDLSGFSGIGSIAIRHYDITGQIRLLIDDIVLTDSQGNTILSEDFEVEDAISSYISFWDMDGDGFGWDYGHYGESKDPYGNCYFNGKGGMDSESWREYAGNLMPDNWLVISGVKLGGTLTLYARNYNVVTYKENFGVYVCPDEVETVNVDGNSYNTAVIMDNPYSWRVRTVEGNEKSNWVASSFMSSDNLKVFSGNGDWDDDDNWAPKGVPTYDNKVIIEGKVTVPDGVIAQARKIILKDYGEITIDEGGQLKHGSSSVMVNMKKSVAGGTDNLISSPVIDRENIYRMGLGSYWVDNLVEKKDYYDLYAFDPTREEEWVNGKITEYYPTSNFDLFKGGMKWGNGYYYSYKEDHAFTYTGFTSSSYLSEISEPLNYNSTCTDIFNGWKLVGNPFTCNCKISYSSATFFKLNASGDKFDMYYGYVVLAPGEGAFMKVTKSGNIIYSSEVPENPASSVGAVKIPFLPLKGLVANQDAASYKLSADGSRLSGLATDYAGHEMKVEFIRDFCKGVASTVCLPFSMTDVTGGTLYEFVDVTYNNVDGWVATMQDANIAAKPTVADKPYLFMPNKNGSVAFRGNIDVIPSSFAAGETTAAHTGGDAGNWTFHGTYDNITWDSSMGVFYGFAAKSADSVNPGDFVKATNGASVPPYRCYLTYNGTSLRAQMRSVKALSEPQIPSNIKVKLLDNDVTVTAVGWIDTDSGDVTIDRWYDMNGHELDGAPMGNGMFIHNGKAVLIDNVER